MAQPAPSVNTLSARRISLDSDWKFLWQDTTAGVTTSTDPASTTYNDISWTTVSLPHTAHIEPLVASHMWQGVCWYLKHITLQPEWRDKKVSIDFGAAMSIADIWVNGQPATTHYGGYLPFSVDLTGKLHTGDNVIAVRLDNRDNPEVPPGKPYKKLDFTWYSGLYRDVSLRVTDRLHITDAVQAGLPASGGVFVTYPKVTTQEATVNVRLHVVNDHTKGTPCLATFTLVDTQGHVAAKPVSAFASMPAGSSHVFSQTLTVDNPQLWSPDNPYQYQLRCAITNGTTIVDTVQTHIGIRHIAFGASGGFQINGKRMYLRGCNRAQEYAYIGYALSDNAQYRDALKIKQAGFDFVRLSHYPQSPAFLDACDALGLVVMEPIPGWQFFGDTVFQQRSIQDCRDMIRRDRNHPSIVLWETSLNETHMSQPFMASLQSAAHEEYPGDQCFTAGWQDSFDVFIQARQAGGCHNYKNGDKACLVSEYGDWEYYAGNAGLNQTAMQNLHGYERNSRQTRADGEVRLLRQAHNFQQAANDNRSTPAIGDAVWCMYDYSRGYAEDIATCGTADSLRIPKFSYYFFQSQRDTQSGPIVHIASFWNSASPADVTVYSNCDEVELTINGKVIGRHKPDVNDDTTRLPHPPFTFHLGQFTAGTLRAVGLVGGKPEVIDTVTTAGQPAALQLRADLSARPFTADGSDAIFVYADVIDTAGNVVRTAAMPIKYTVTGAAHLIGDNPVSAAAGTAGILLQAGNKPGSVSVEASADGLLTGKLTVPLVKP